MFDAHSRVGFREPLCDSFLPRAIVPVSSRGRTSSARDERAQPQPTPSATHTPSSMTPMTRARLRAWGRRRLSSRPAPQPL